MDEWLKHIPYWLCILVLLILFAIRWTAPVVTKSVQTLQQVAVPGIPVTQYPIMDGGCSRVHLQLVWQ